VLLCGILQHTNACSFAPLLTPAQYAKTYEQGEPLNANNAKGQTTIAAAYRPSFDNSLLSYGWRQTTNTAHKNTHIRTYAQAQQYY
jgi:hypothetical protein